MRKRHEAGFTLVEQIMAVVIGGVLFYSLSDAFLTSTVVATKDEFMAEALYLANGKLETVSSRSFSLVSSESLSAFPGSFTDFKSQVEITNVDSSSLDTSIGSASSGYKKVTVKVSSSSIEFGFLELSTLITDVTNP